MASSLSPKIKLINMSDMVLCNPVNNSNVAHERQNIMGRPGDCKMLASDSHGVQLWFGHLAGWSWKCILSKLYLASLVNGIYSSSHRTILDIKFNNNIK